MYICCQNVDVNNYRPIGPSQLGSRDQIFAQNVFYIMGYNLKNARNGKSISKIPKWPSLKPLALKSKFIQQFEFSENLEDICVKCCWRATLQTAGAREI